MSGLKTRPCQSCHGHKCSQCLFNGFVLVDAEPAMDFWIYDGRSSAFELRHEIHNHGGYFVKSEKRYKIMRISRDCDAYATLKACGLRLIPIAGTELE